MVWLILIAIVIAVIYFKSKNKGESSPSSSSAHGSSSTYSSSNSHSTVSYRSLPQFDTVWDAIEKFCSITSSMNSSLSYVYDKGFCSLQGKQVSDGVWDLIFRFNKCSGLFKRVLEEQGYSVETLPSSQDSYGTKRSGWTLYVDQEHSSDDVLEFTHHSSTDPSFWKPFTSDKGTNSAIIREKVEKIIGYGIGTAEKVDVKANFDPNINQYWFIATVTYPGREN